MKVISTLLALALIFSSELISQVPSGFAFQAVARDQQYNLIKNQSITVTVGIRSGSADGVLDWEETHTTSTNEFGLFSLDICNDNELRTGGTVQEIIDIPWGAEEHYLDLKIDTGEGMVSLGSTRLLSVPYSLVSSTISQPVANLIVQPDMEVESGNALFEVKRADGYPVFAVYEDGVWVYTDTTDAGKGVKRGFAVGGYSRDSKGPAEEYFRVTPDSTRVYVKETEAKGVKGGFAVGGYSRDRKSVSSAFMSLDKENYFIGHNSGANISAGLYNSVMGYESGINITSGESNAFMGYQSGYHNESGSGNLFLGYQTGYSNRFGDYNTFLGYKTGYSNNGGINNTFLGSFAGHKSTEGNHNTFVGDYAGYNNINGEDNSFIGTRSGFHNTYGSSNVFLGYNAGFSNILGYSNVFIGHKAGYSFLESGENIFIGNECGINSKQGKNNIFLGSAAGANNEDGHENVFIGFQSGMFNENGQRNVFIGPSSGKHGNVSDKLIISNTDDDSTLVLIWGDFLARRLRFNSLVGIGVQPEYAELEIGDSMGPAELRLKGTGGSHNYSMISLESDEDGQDKSFLLSHRKDNNFAIYLYDGINYLPRILITPEGNISMGSWDPGTERLDVHGNARFRAVGSAGSANDLRITADGTLTTNTSDIRMKADLHQLENSLEKIMGLDGYTFSWVDSPDNNRDAGLIAQEVNEVFPEAVFTNQADGYMGINYSRFPALFVEAFKEQQSIIDEQMAEIDRLNRSYENLKNNHKNLNDRLQALEAMLE